MLPVYGTYKINVNNVLNT